MGIRKVSERRVQYHLHSGTITIGGIYCRVTDKITDFRRCCKQEIDDSLHVDLGAVILCSRFSSGQAV
ncbi:MAG TPA: hypothetical protein VGK10_00065 [Prolixibacteraceae bacterium]